MSVVKVQRTKSVAAATIYAVHGTHENMRNGVVRAAAYSVVGVSPEATPMQFVSDTVAEHARHPQRETQAILVIQSFHPDELDKDDPFDVQLAHLAGMELGMRTNSWSACGGLCLVVMHSVFVGVRRWWCSRRRVSTSIVCECRSRCRCQYSRASAPPSSLTPPVCL